MVEPPDGEQEEAQREKGRDKLERVLRRSLFFQPGGTGEPPVSCCCNSVSADARQISSGRRCLDVSIMSYFKRALGMGEIGFV